jgi:crotonobetainyl-CoA:carnitine CoA-transferase CaiB-like acyl-CoA transferase
VTDPASPPGSRIWPDDPIPASGPLAGVRVLDLTTVVMGPSATQLLGDLGADVVKVETPGGDSMRLIGPWRHRGMGPMFLQANRNKRSVMLDLKQARDKASMLALAGRADVLVTNVRPAGLQRLGLDEASVRAVNPGLIYCSAVGYGSAGRHAGKPVYDDLMQAASGIAGLFGVVDGKPRYAPVNMCDRVVGLYVANAIMAALLYRARTGRGQAIEVPMFETMAQFVLADHMGGSAFSPPIGPVGYGRILASTRGPFRTSDGFLSLVVYTDRHWRDFSALVGHPDLLDRDERFATPQNRNLNAEETGTFIAAQLTSRSNAEWLAALEAIDIPASPVNSLQDLFDDPHLGEVGLFATMQHPTEGALTVTRFPARFSETPAEIRRLAPNLGAHNREVLGDAATA